MIQRPFISSRYDRMKHTSQIPEETVNRFINESMKTKTMLEAKKKAKNFDYSNEGGAGKRERQEMEEPQGGKKESKWSKFKKAMNNAAGRVTSGDRFIRDTGMKMDHQEHEGELQNELSADLAGRASRLARAKQGAALKQGKVWKGLRKGTQSNRFQAYSGEESRKKGSGPAARQTLKRRQNSGAPGWGKTFPPQIPPAVLDRISIGENLPSEGELQNEVKPAHSEGVRSLIPLSELSRELALRAGEKRRDQFVGSRMRGDDKPISKIVPGDDAIRAKRRQEADSMSVRQSKVFNAYAKGGREGYRGYKDEQTRKHGVALPKNSPLPRNPYKKGENVRRFSLDTGIPLGREKNPRFRPPARKITGGGVGSDTNLPIGAMRRGTRR